MVYIIMDNIYRALTHVLDTPYTLSHLIPDNFRKKTLFFPILRLSHQGLNDLNTFPNFT